MMKQGKISARLTKRVLTGLSAACLLLASGAIKADTIEWSGAGDGETWQDAQNWDDSGSLPGEDDIAFFDSGASWQHTIKFTATPTNLSLHVGNDNLLFDLKDAGYHLNNVIRIGTSSGSEAYLQITNGLLSLESSSETTSAIGADADSKASLILRGEGSGIDVRGSKFYVGSGARSDACLEIADGATADFPNKHFYVANGTDSTGRVFVSNGSLTPDSATGTATGSGSYGEIIVSGPEAKIKFRSNGALYHGHTGIGRIAVIDGSNDNRGGYMVCGSGGGTGIVTVAGSGSYMYFSKVLLGADKSIIGEAQSLNSGAGIIEVYDGGHFRATTRNDAFDQVFIGPTSMISIRDGTFDTPLTGSDRHNPLFFYPGSTLRIELTSDTLDHIAEKGALIISGANKNDMVKTNIIEGANLDLRLAAGFVPNNYSSYRIFRYEGDLHGAFDGLPDGKEFFVDGHRFRINYGAGTADDIILTALPPEGSVIVIR